MWWFKWCKPGAKPIKVKIETDPLPDGCWRVNGGVQCSWDIKISIPKEFEEEFQELKKIEGLKHLGMLRQGKGYER